MTQMESASAPKNADDTPSTDMFSALKLIKSPIGKFRGSMIMSVSAAILSAVLELVPYLLAYLLIVDVVSGTAAPSKFFIYGLILLVVIPTTHALFGFATTKSHTVAFNLIHDLRDRLARHMAELPLGYFSKQKSGTARKLLVEEPERLELLVAHAIPEGVGAFSSWILVSAWLLWMDWRMALAAMVLTPISFAILFAAMSVAMPKMAPVQKANNRMNNAVGEFLAGISAIKIFRGDKAHKETVESVEDLAIRMSEMGREYVPLGGSFYALVLANITLILPVGMYLMSVGQIDLPMLMFFVIVGGNYSAPLMRLFSIFHSFANISVTATALQTAFDVPKQSDTNNRYKLENYDIEFDHVTFGYGEKMVVNDLSFKAKTGTVTALVGPSGSGKSTVANLIARFYDPSAGKIQIGSYDISQMGREQLMETVGFVFQDTFLFSATIEENLRFARPDATEEDIHAAARAAQAHDFIMAMPNGYQTKIGDGSGVLSGGERQRLAIARVMLKNPPIIVLDEATAFSDPDNESEIQKAVSEMTKGKTLVVIAHRLHTIQDADQILVLEHGQLCGAGSHAQLMKNSPLYQEMWECYESISSNAKAAKPSTREEA